MYPRKATILRRSCMCHRLGATSPAQDPAAARIRQHTLPPRCSACRHNPHPTPSQTSIHSPSFPPLRLALPRSALGHRYRTTAFPVSARRLSRASMRRRAPRIISSRRRASSAARSVRDAADAGRAGCAAAASSSSWSSASPSAGPGAGSASLPESLYRAIRSGSGASAALAGVWDGWGVVGGRSGRKDGGGCGF